ncbi:hypothetical protein MUP77_22840 [Candidatus Bathyarchaeota archaeon]|nr:hypothetical protein [Candidatus Bathyarchaeota archaeon]
MTKEGTPDWIGKTIEVKRAKCPNCGANDIDFKWISKVPKQTFKDTNFDEYAEALKETKKPRSTDSGILDFRMFDSLSDYLQLVIQCKQCGYTETFNLP